MYTSIVRAQNIFSFFTTVALVVACLVATTDLISPRVPSGTIKTTNVQVYASEFPSISPRGIRRC